MRQAVTSAVQHFFVYLGMRTRPRTTPLEETMNDLTAHLTGLAARFPYTDEPHLAHAARLPGGLATHIAATHQLTVNEAHDALEEFVLMQLGSPAC